MNITTNRTPTQSKQEKFQPFSFVGNWKPQWIYVSDSRNRHAVYDRLLSILENRQVVDNATGRALPYLYADATRKALRTAGRTELQIEQGESSIHDHAEIHPRWNIQRTVPSRLYYHLRKEGREDVIFEQRIVDVPNELTNALACQKLLSMFSMDELLAVNGFRPRLGKISVRLDIDPYLSRSGFIVPTVVNGLIDNLKVYRNPTDTRPFVLRTRRAKYA